MDNSYQNFTIHNSILMIPYDLAIYIMYSLCIFRGMLAEVCAKCYSKNLTGGCYPPLWEPLDFKDKFLRIGDD